MRAKRCPYRFDAARFVHCPHGAAKSDRAALVDAWKKEHRADYAGDVWRPQPGAADHAWRTMPFNGMTPHVSGTSLSAQARCAAGTLEFLECFFEGRPIREEYLIVDSGKLAGAGVKSHAVK